MGRLYRTRVLVFVPAADVRAFNDRIVELFDRAGIDETWVVDVGLHRGQQRNLYYWSQVPLTDEMSLVLRQLANEFPDVVMRAKGRKADEMAGSNVTKEDYDPQTAREEMDLERNNLDQRR